MLNTRQLTRYFIMATKPIIYKNNPNLKAAGAITEFTAFQVDEYIKCAKDPIYFLENYAKIVSLDEGVVSFIPYEFQKAFVESIHNNRLTIGLMGRQLGKSTICAGYIAWYVLFNDNKRAAILANKKLVSQEIFSRVKFIIENLPLWLQKGVHKWAETSFKLDNGSSCFCAATSPSAVRGLSINLLMLDEFGFLSTKLADNFIASVFPTISSSKESKMMIVSTPNGLNHFYKIWIEAVNKKNGFTPIQATWKDHPNRDQAWADAELISLGPVRYAQEVECNFASSSYTLISGSKLTSIPTIKPIFIKDSLSVYFEPIKGHSYVCSVDTSRGQHLDYSAFVVFDITTLPYKVVATYKNNQISPMAYPFLIMQICQKYNNAHTLVEINDIGGAVADTLAMEYEYENMYWTYHDTLNEGRGYPGVRTTKKVKSIGCSNLKDLVEGDHLEINSEDILTEFSVFVQKGASYSAEDTVINDDLTACCFLFAWLVKQPIFAELTDTNIRAILAKKTEAYIEENMLPFGFVEDGQSEDAGSQFDIPVDPMTKWMFS